MKDGFIKVAATANEITVADVKSNTKRILERISDADKAGINMLVFPELCITGYTCADLFFSSTLINGALGALEEICNFTKNKYPIIIVGLPISFSGKLYNCAAVIQNGRVLGVVPKTAIPNYGEFSEKRYFQSADTLPPDLSLNICGCTVPFSSKLIFKSSELDEFTFGIEICEDLWKDIPPSSALCRAGAAIIANPSASDECVSKAEYRRLLVSSASAKQICGYIYSGAHFSESTQDLVFSAHSMIYEKGKLLAENKPFSDEKLCISEIDIQRLTAERIKNTEFEYSTEDIKTIVFSQEVRDNTITRHIDRNPFAPDDCDINTRAEEILTIQSYGLKKRLEHTNAKAAVIGISGGLDSTLALLVTVRAMKLCGRPASDIIAVTMPCFGTTKRTKSNAVRLCEELGINVREINITKSVLSHFEDIGQSAECYDVTYENSQARERTQVLMDIANQCAGLVIGTGDLSELALGWATYNGDQMSMYGINASVPKTLIRHIVRYEAERAAEGLKETLLNILDTPVSPELLPADENGEIAQKTEDFVGPYELHDFFLYYTLRHSFSPKKIFRLCIKAFEGEYDKDTVIKWLTVFTRRFFSQQFKRSCLPDGPKVGSVTLSPRGDWRMPSDASAKIWLDEIEEIKLL